MATKAVFSLTVWMVTAALVAAWAFASAALGLRVADVLLEALPEAPALVFEEVLTVPADFFAATVFRLGVVLVASAAGLKYWSASPSAIKAQTARFEVMSVSRRLLHFSSAGAACEAPMRAESVSESRQIRLLAETD